MAVRRHTMKLTILLCSLLFSAIAAKDVYVEGATTVDSPGAAAVLPAAKLGVNETPAANHRRMNGEEACENHGYNFRECQQVGCCQWARCPSTSAVAGGQCHSVVHDGQCTDQPFDWHYQDGPHCRADLKDTHVDGCRRRGFWGWFSSWQCGPCEGDCDRDADCRDKGNIGITGRIVLGKCFQRDGYTPVPGCKGTGKNNWDYCISSTWL